MKKILICIIGLCMSVAIGLSINKVLNKMLGVSSQEIKKDNNNEKITEKDNLKGDNNLEENIDKEQDKIKKEEEVKNREEELKKQEKEKIEAAYHQIKDENNYTIKIDEVSQIMKARKVIEDKYGSKYKNVICIGYEKNHELNSEYYIFGENVRGEVNKDKLFLVDKSNFEVHEYRAE
ncbi:hypothetical protein [Romboutsia sp.]|uniref:hypothetical protein n=1 Tax=Romboutsia sp. TaxID=1965302 RepID=UPI003F371833